MDEDLPFSNQPHENYQDQVPKNTKEHFHETKKSFSSSKNQFLSTIFETKLAKQRKLSIQKNLDETNAQNDQNTQVKFTISIQYSQFYDPLNDKEFHVKGKRPFYKKIRLGETQSKSDNQKQSKKKTQKQFVQIHQPRSQDQEIEFKLYQEELRKKSTIPGPGAYNIAKPLAEPVYETIQKNEKIVLVKLHNVQGTSNFKSGNAKLTAIYDKQKLKNPGPGDYATTVEDLNIIKRQRNKSKLDQYAKKYQSNYKFIFQVFNSQLNSHESIPNYSVKDPENEVIYNGKPSKMQQLYLDVKKQNELKEERSRKYLHKKAKNPSFTKDFQRKRSISQIQTNVTKSAQPNKIFEFNTVNQEELKIRQERFKIYSQVDEKVENKYSIEKEIESSNINQALIKKKIHKLIHPIPEQRATSHLQKYKKKEHLYNGFGYFDGTQKQTLNTKYNVKLEKRDQKLKKLLQPLPNTARNFQSLQVPDQGYSKTSRFHENKSENRYHMNMLDILVSQQKKAKKDVRNLLPNSRVSFNNDLELNKSYLNSTIQY